MTALSNSVKAFEIHLVHISFLRMKFELLMMNYVESFISAMLQGLG